MKKKELPKPAGVNAYTINKFNKNGNVTLKVLSKTCKALDCSLDDIMKFEDRKKSAVFTVFIGRNVYNAVLADCQQL